jgi:hypothetical protein
MELTIRARRLPFLIVALAISIAGAGLAAWNSRSAEVDESKVKEKPIRQFLLTVAPFIGGLIAGIVAAFAVYADDPTWGANLGSDVTKLVAATFAAAVAGLTVIAPVARGTRQRLAPPGNQTATADH